MPPRVETSGLSGVKPRGEAGPNLSRIKKLACQALEARGICDRPQLNDECVPREARREKGLPTVSLDPPDLLGEPRRAMVMMDGRVLVNNSGDFVDLGFPPPTSFGPKASGSPSTAELGKLVETAKTQLELGYLWPMAKPALPADAQPIYHQDPFIESVDVYKVGPHLVVYRESDPPKGWFYLGPTNFKPLEPNDDWT